MEILGYIFTGLLVGLGVFGIGYLFGRYKFSVSERRHDDKYDR